MDIASWGERMVYLEEILFSCGKSMKSGASSTHEINNKIMVAKRADLCFMGMLFKVNDNGIASS